MKPFIKSFLKVSFLFFVLFYCSTTEKSVHDQKISEVKEVVENSNKVVGEECTTNEECDTGVCYWSEFAPFGICTKECKNPGEFCDNDKNIFCVQFPDEFIGNVKSFCLRVCKTIDDCMSFSNKYEKCEKPQYRLNPIYPELPVLVCDNPSNAGKKPVDPETCDWSEYKGKFPEEDELCISYCEFLKMCDHLPSEISSSCCEWGCYQKIISGNQVNFEYRNYVRCYVEYFESFNKSKCSPDLIDENCGGKPEVP